MKTVISSILTLVGLVCLSAIATEDVFIDALRNCTPYNETGNVNANGIIVNSHKQMVGWQNNKCVYKESLKYNDMNITTTCRFNRSQIAEIVSVADAYFLTLKYTGQPETPTADNIKNNPLAQVLGKYLQDPSVCSVDGLEQ